MTGMFFIRSKLDLLIIKRLAMRKFMYFLFLILALSNCKKDDPEPDAIIEGVVGSWRLIEIENTIDGKKVWQDVEEGEQTIFTVRFDGVLLDESGFAYCCPASRFIVNGTTYHVVAKAEITLNPICVLASCAPCDNWEIQHQGDEMITNGCFNAVKSKYIRIK
jgi:hypothetical protein